MDKQFLLLTLSLPSSPRLQSLLQSAFLSRKANMGDLQVPLVSQVPPITFTQERLLVPPQSHEPGQAKYLVHWKQSCVNSIIDKWAKSQMHRVAGSAQMNFSYASKTGGSQQERRQSPVPAGSPGTVACVCTSVYWH